MPSTPALSHSVDLPDLKNHEQLTSQPVKSRASSSSRERSINEVTEETLDHGQEVQDPGVILPVDASESRFMSPETADGISNHANLPATHPPEPPTLTASDLESDTAASELAARKTFYTGLPSCPTLVAYSGSHPWPPTIDPDSGPTRRKQLSPVGEHPIKEVWAPKLSRDIRDVLRANKVSWTSLDLVRIGYVGSPDSPVTVWIGVKARTLDSAQGRAVVDECQERVRAYGLDDVNVEIRESVVRASRPKRPFVPVGPC